MRWLVVLLLGCRPAQPAAPLGGSQDDGAGDLANASTRLMTAEGSDADPFAPRKRKHDDAALGGTTYGNYVVRSWQGSPGVHRTYPRHEQKPGLADEKALCVHGNATRSKVRSPGVVRCPASARRRVVRNSSCRSVRIAGSEMS